MSIRRQIADGTALVQKLLEYPPVFLRFTHNANGRMIRPLVYQFHRFAGAKRICEDTRARRHAKKPQQDNLRETDRFIVGKRRVPPRQDQLMPRGALIDGVKQYVQVNEFHFRRANFSRLSSSSSDTAIASALSRLTFGSPMGYVF